MPSIKMNLVLTPQNERHDINICVKHSGDFYTLQYKVNRIIKGLSDLFPEGYFSIKIEDINTFRTWYYKDGKYLDENFNEIKQDRKILLN